MKKELTKLSIIVFTFFIFYFLILGVVQILLETKDPHWSSFVRGSAFTLCILNVIRDIVILVKGEIKADEKEEKE